MFLNTNWSIEVACTDIVSQFYSGNDGPLATWRMPRRSNWHVARPAGGRPATRLIPMVSCYNWIISHWASRSMRGPWHWRYESRIAGCSWRLQVHTSSLVYLHQTGPTQSAQRHGLKRILKPWPRWEQVIESSSVFCGALLLQCATSLIQSFIESIFSSMLDKITVLFLADIDGAFNNDAVHIC